MLCTNVVGENIVVVVVVAAAAAIMTTVAVRVTTIATNSIMIDVTAQLLMGVKSCYVFFRDAMTSNAFFCFISLVTDGHFLHSSSKPSSPFLSMALKFS